MLPIRQLLAERKMKSNSLLFLTSNRFGGVRREGKFKVLQLLPHTSIRLGIVKSDNFGWMVHFSATIETMVAIDWVCCRFFICLYDLNTVCFLSSSSWVVVETQILVCLCSANNQMCHFFVTVRLFLKEVGTVGVVPGDELECLVE